MANPNSYFEKFYYLLSRVTACFLCKFFQIPWSWQVLSMLDYTQGIKFSLLMPPCLIISNKHISWESQRLFFFDMLRASNIHRWCVVLIVENCMPIFMDIFWVILPSFIHDFWIGFTEPWSNQLECFEDHEASNKKIIILSWFKQSWVIIKTN